jgi:hypothetical protein
MTDFGLELDHVVIFTAKDAPEAAALAPHLQGFGGVTVHGELGSASTSFFFTSMYLELLWATDPAACARNFLPLGLDINARMRWRETGGSPFGLMLRQKPGEAEPIPFATKTLHATWMPGDVRVQFSGERLAEPYYGVVPEPLGFPSFRANIPALPHPCGARVLTGVHLSMTDAPSEIARLVSDAGLATVERGPEPLMTLTFDDGAQGQSMDVRPTLPLVLKF